MDATTQEIRDIRIADGSEYEVEGYGTITLENGVWLFCADLPDVLMLRKGESHHINFTTGMGTTRSTVKRIS